MTPDAPIIQVVQHLSPGGIETMAIDFARMSPGGRPTYIVSLEGTKASAIKDWDVLRPFSDRLIFLDKSPGWSPATLGRLTRVLRELKPQAVHTHHTGPMLYGGLAARLARVPRLVHTEHDAWHLENRKRRALVCALSVLLRPSIVADAEVVARIFERRALRPVDRVILNGIDTERFRPGPRGVARRSLGLPETGRIVGVAGRLEHVKAQDIALSALAQMPDREVTLAIAGDGSEREKLVAQAGRLGIKHRVTFLGRVDDMPSFYQAIDVLCMPSRREGLPLSVLEAQACGLPVVATDVGGVSEAVCPVTGYLVEAEQPAALAKMLAKRLKNPNGNPRNFACHVGSRDRMVAQYAELML